jgi:hypothetical protein
MGTFRFDPRHSRNPSFPRRRDVIPAEAGRHSRGAGNPRRPHWGARSGRTFNALGPRLRGDDEDIRDTSHV